MMKMGKTYEKLKQLETERDALKRRVEAMAEWIDLARPLLKMISSDINCGMHTHFTETDIEGLETLLEASKPTHKEEEEAK